MSDILGGIRVNSMIWMASALTLGSLYICWTNCVKQDPTIMDTAMQYPYTIIFRVGMLYSLFIYFLLFIFIKWWLDSSQYAKHTKLLVVMSTLGLLSYGLFVACIDRQRINYPLAASGVFWSSILVSGAIYLTLWNLKRIVKRNPTFIGQTSHLAKQFIGSLQFSGMFLGMAIYTGQMDIDYKHWVQYWTVITTILFMWTFVMDFKRFKMDIDKIPKKPQMQMNNMGQNNDYRAQIN